MSDPKRLASWIEQSQPEREPPSPAEQDQMSRAEREFFAYRYPAGRPNQCPGGMTFALSTHVKSVRRGCSAPVEGRNGLCASCSRYEAEQRQRMRDAREKPEEQDRKSGRWSR